MIFNMHCKVVFEPPRPNRTIPQCANCQQYVTEFQNASNVQETINLQVALEKRGQMMKNVSSVREITQQITKAVVYTSPSVKQDFLHLKSPKILQYSKRKLL